MGILDNLMGMSVQQPHPSSSGTPQGVVQDDVNNVDATSDNKPVHESNLVEGQDYVAHKNYRSNHDFCGLTVIGIEGNHFCNHCGRPASLMVKRWDSAVQVWAKYLCQADWQLEVSKFRRQIDSNGNTDNTTDSTGK